MAITFKFYADAALTTELTEWLPTEAADESSYATDLQCWFGSTDNTKKVQAVSDPGVDQITVSIADALPAGGQADTAIRLAATSGGLAAAVPGAGLNLGVQVLGGVANAEEIWVRIRATDHTVGYYDDLSLTINQLTEVPV